MKPRTTLIIAVLSTFLLLAGCTQRPSAPAASLTETATESAQRVEIRKSPNDTRAYRFLTLPNQLRVVLVSDPHTEKAAAALAVYRGSQHEPEHRPGLAHFLEHMLFIQTETYPEIDGFQTYISANGGSSNAYTALDHTNYFFDVRPGAFDEALDRFAHFFIDPVISAEYSAREKNAVHSEYQMQLKDDGWRGYMASKRALNPQHPASRFTIGSLETLDGDIHQDLLAFFDSHYSADQMALVAVSDRSLDSMEQQIRPLFGQIENKQIGPAYPEVPMFTEEQLPVRLETQTLKEGAALSYTFPMPSTRPYYREKPQQYFANLLGHEGTGSLYQALKQLGWIESLGASVGELDRNSSQLSINIELTPSGRDHIDGITGLLFEYVDMLRKQPPQRWLYEEQATVAEMNFRFQEKSSPMGLVYQLAPRVDQFPPGDLLVAPYLMEDFDAQEIQHFLSFVRPDNLMLELHSPDIEGESVEPWFDVPYTLIPGPVTQPAQVSAELALPSRNPFLPEDLSLHSADQAPIAKAVDEPGLELWLDTDTQFGSPRANLYLELAVDGGFLSARDRAMAQLYRLLVEDSLSELVYPAYLAGLGYSLAVPDAGYQISIGGYQDKQSELLQSVLRALTGMQLQQERFALLKASLIRDWRNTAKERPFRQAFAAVSDTLRSGRYPRPQLIDALQDVTLQDLTRWRDTRLSRLAVRGLLHGNATAHDLSEVQALLKQRLPLQPLEFADARVRDVPGLIRLQLPVDHNDASLVIHVQDEDESYASRARSALAAQILRPAYFNDLRTEQQLGYVVSVSNSPIADRGGVSFIVQSPNTSSAQLEVATRTFFDQFMRDWLQEDPAQLEQHRAGLLNRLLEAPKNLNEKSARYWADLTDEVYSFDSRQQIAAYVQQLTKQDMTEYLQALQRKLGEQRLAVYTQGSFDDVPQQGELLDSASDDWSSARSG